MPFRFWQIWLVSFFAIASPAMAQEPPRPKTRPEWQARLLALQSPLTRDDYLFLAQFQALDAGTVYLMLRETWERIGSESGKAHIVGAIAFEHTNAHLFKVLHMGRTDPSPLVRKAAVRCLRILTFLDLSEDAAYLQWHKEMAGRSLKERLESGCRAFTAQVQSAPIERRVTLLDSLLEVPFLTFLQRTAQEDTLHAEGLTGIRRNALLASGLVADLIAYLKTSHPPALRRQALLCIAHIQPDRALLRQCSAEVRRELPALLQSDRNTFREKSALLSALSEPWALDALLRLCEEAYGEQEKPEILSALFGSQSPRAIPLLITLGETLEPQEKETAQLLSQGLARLAKWRGERQSAMQWREWWYNNRGALSLAAQPFPRLEVSERADITLYRRIRRPVCLPNATRPAYWLVSSGLIARNGSKRRPGVLVVVANQETEAEAQGALWQEIAESAFRGDYLVAWVPGRDALGVAPDAKRLESIAQDLAKNLPIDKSRIWLHSIGAAGLSTYRAALAPKTLYRGFWIRDSAFRLASLPSLHTAKNRLFLIQHPQNNAKISYLQATIAQTRLAQAGADAVLQPLASEPPNRESVGAAVTWLENRAQIQGRSRRLGF